MAFKRKRSADDSPLSISSFGRTASTPEEQSPTPFHQNFDNGMDIDVDSSSRHNGWDFMSASRVKSSDWGMRTRKRFRDNRPDERVIHENTLNKLFAAQRNHPHAEPIPSETLVQAPQPLTSKPQKSTLHSFWKQLPALQAQPPIFSLPTPAQQVAHGPRCDDCDTPLQSDDSMDMDVDMDTDAPVGNSPFACSECGKNVCSTCAVVATKRHCLQCATRGRQSRRWW